MKRLRDSIQTRLALLGVAMSILALGSIALIDSYYRATYRDETTGQLIAFSVATFRASIKQIDNGDPIVLSKPSDVLGPLYSVEPPTTSMKWPRPHLVSGAARILKEPVSNFETRYVPLSDRPLWVSFPASGKTYWLALPLGVEGRPRPWVLLVGATLALASLAGFGSFVLVVKPIRRLGGIIKSGQPRPESPTADAQRKPEPAEIEEVLAAFEALLVRISKQDQERDLSLAAISHDLRAPLARLRMRLETQDNQHLRTASVADICDIDHVLSQFLAYVRGDYQSEADTSLSKVFEELAGRYKGRNVSFEMEEVLEKLFPREAITRILTNLIDNALTHGQAPVTVTARNLIGAIELSISDCGPGFCEAQVEAAIAPFSQLNPARTTGGSGLGLTIVVRLAKALSGDVRFERTQGSFNVKVVLAN